MRAGDLAVTMQAKREGRVEKSAYFVVNGGVVVVGLCDLFSSLQRTGLLPHGAAILRSRTLARGR